MCLPALITLGCVVLGATADHVSGQGPPVRIMPLGDSITAGSGSSDFAGYRRILYNSMIAEGYGVDFVGSQQGGLGDFDPDHEGHAGWRDDQIAANVVGFLTAHPADIVLLHIGINSLDPSPTDVEAILDNVESVNPDIIVVLARIVSVACCGDVPPCTNCETVTQFNDNVQAMASARIARGAKILLVDMEHALSYPGDLSDAVHPNDSGYSKMAAVWLPAVREAIAQVKTLAILQQPVDAAVRKGDNAVFSIVAGGSGPLHYQWFENGVPVGTDSDVLTLAGVDLTYDGVRVSCSVRDYRSEVLSTEALLAVTCQLAILIDGDGAVVLDPPGGLYREGTVVKLTPAPLDAWHFSSWNGAAQGDFVPEYVAMVDDLDVGAVFVPDPPKPSGQDNTAAEQPVPQASPNASDTQSGPSCGSGLCGTGTSPFLTLLLIARLSKWRAIGRRMRP